MRKLYIIRGLPGSGKSTLARIITGNNAAADDYFMTPEGEYKFDINEVPKAHLHCQEVVRNYMYKGKKVIAVHNTFTQRWEMEPYIKMARYYGYSVCEIVCNGNFANTHGVSAETIERMRERWEN